VRIYHVDVTRATDVYASAERVRHDLGQVTILVANAGYVSGRSLLTESDIDIERTFGVNSLSPIWLIKAFLPYMLDANRGHVVIISSVLGMKNLNIHFRNTSFFFNIRYPCLSWSNKLCLIQTC